MEYTYSKGIALLKTCVNCGEVHYLTEFHYDPDSKDERGSICKPCLRKAE